VRFRREWSQPVSTIRSPPRLPPPCS
jgi:hypothetical protein